MLFSEAVFDQAASFDSGVFSGERTSFGDVRFAGTCTFDRCRFDGYATYRAARFEAGASFEHGTYSAAASFRHTVFGDMAMFRRAEFAGLVEFDGARFGGHSAFDRADFAGGVIFNGEGMGVMSAVGARIGPEMPRQLPEGWQETVLHEGWIGLRPPAGASDRR